MVVWCVCMRMCVCSAYTCVFTCKVWQWLCVSVCAILEVVRTYIHTAAALT